MAQPPQTKSIIDLVDMGETAEAVQLIQASNPNAIADEENGDTLAFYVTAFGNDEMFAAIDFEQVDIAQLNGVGENILHSSIYSNDVNRVSAILGHKPNLNVVNNDGHTALILALELGQQETSELLVASGADVNLGSIEGDQALHLACTRNFVELAAAIVPKCDHLLAKNGLGNNPISIAANNEAFGLVEMMVEATG
ncbi:MAG: ankyrin repeat domain-containing protein [Saprospiraceae bacterium]